MSTPLERLCGISNVVRPKPPLRWLPVTLKFLGAENYVLGTKHAELSLTTKQGGFGIMFKEDVAMPDAWLLGDKAKHGLLSDVVIDFEASTTLPRLSLAALCPGMYPRVLRNGGTIHVC